MYLEIGKIMSKPTFINVLKTLHKLLNNNENFADMDVISQRILYISTIMSSQTLCEILKTDNRLDSKIIEKADKSLEILKNTTDTSKLNFVSILNFITSVSKNLNVAISSIVEDNGKNLNDNCLDFLVNIVPIIAAYNFEN